MTTVHVIDQGRELLRKQEWGAAFSKLTAPEVAPLLGPVDLEGVPKAAYLLVNETDGSEFYRTQPDIAQCAKCDLVHGL